MDVRALVAKPAVALLEVPANGAVLLTLRQLRYAFWAHDISELVQKCAPFSPLAPTPALKEELAQLCLK